MSEDQKDSPFIARHNLGDVWSAIGKQTEDIATVRTDVASLNARVTHGFTGITSQLNSLIDRSNVRPNLAAWLSLAISIVLVIGAIGWANLKPVDERTHRNADQYEDLSRDYWEHKGYTRGMMQNFSHRLERLEAEMDREETRARSRRNGRDD